jgi:hypothetical protein
VTASSTPVAAAGYRFVRWEGTKQIDADGNYEERTEVNPDWIEKTTNTLTIGGDDESYILSNSVYYAVFEPITLTIYKTGQDISATDSFLFRIQGKAGTATAGVDLTVSITGSGSTTISYIPAGDYTVTEINNWSWRYLDVQAQEIQVVDTGNNANTVTFTNSKNTKTWLGGESSNTNIFSAYSNS